MCQIDESYIVDAFNMTGLNEMVVQYRDARQMILDTAPSEDDSETEYYAHKRIVEKAAISLYGLIHQRYVLSLEGTLDINQKYRRRVYGICPRVKCFGTHVLPVGMSDVLGDSTVKLYCASCFDVYEPPLLKHRTLDGAFFGTGLPHMFYMTHPQLRPIAATQKYEAKLFGFKMHHKNGELCDST